MYVKLSQFAVGGEMLVGDIAAGLRAGLDTQFDFPGTGIKDAAGGYLLQWLAGAGPNVNYIATTSSIASSPPLINAIGTDTNIDLTITAKGTGHVAFGGTGAVGVPVGTTAQEPAGFAGGLRYDTDTDFLRYWDVGVGAWVDIIAGSAFNTATYVTNIDETTDLPNSQPLSALATGIMRVTTATGIIDSLAIPLSATLGGTGIANASGSTVTLDGALSTVGAFTAAFTMTGNTAVTFPTSGTLSTTVGTVTSVSGTTNEIDSTGGATPVLSLSATAIAPGTLAVTTSLNINSTIDVVGVIDDDSMATATDTNISTAEAMKAYVDAQISGSGDVVGPASATDNALARFDTTTGKLLQNSIVIVDDAGAVTGLTSLDIAGTVAVVAVIDDDTMATATDTNLSTSEAIKAYVDSGAGGGGTVTEVTGTANQIDVATGTTTPALTLSSTIVTPGSVDVGSTLDVTGATTLDTTLNIGGTISIDGVIDDDTFATATALNIPTSESVKAYVDASSSSGDSMIQTVVVTHAFSAGDWVYLNGAVWTLASNASAATAEKVGYISAISTTVSFTLQMGGYITTGLSGLTAGQVSFLGTGGAATTTEPTANGAISLPLFVAQTTTTAIMLTYRGVVVGSAAATGALLSATRLTSGSGTYNVPAGVDKIIVKVQGGGASGGGSNPTATTFSSGAGGGAGGYCEKTYSGISGSSYSYAVGAGGAAAATGADGNNGVASTFDVMTANLGGAGNAGVAVAASVANTGRPGGGGTSSGGDLNFNGGAGTFGFTGNSGGNYAYGGRGGQSPLSGGGEYSVTFTGSTTGIAAPTNSGAGGSGGSGLGTTTAAAGGAGAAGIIIIEEYS